MAESNGVYIKTELDTKGITDGAKVIENSLNDISKTAKETEKATDAAFNNKKKIKIDTGYDAYHEKEEIVDLADRYKELLLKKKDLESQGFGLGHEEYDQTIIYIDELKSQLNEYQKSLTSTEEEEEKTAPATINLASAFSKLGKTLSSKIVSTLKKLRDHFTGVAKKAKDSAISVKNLVLAGLGIRGLYSLVRKLYTSAQEGFRNLVQYSNEVDTAYSNLRNSLTQFKNQLSATFAPVIQAVSNGLATLVNCANNAVSALGNLIAILGGNNTYIRAKKITDSYADSLKNASGAAKQLQTYSFDTLSKASGTGGGSSATSPEDMFEEVSIYEPGEFIQSLIDAFNNGDWYLLGKSISEKFKEVLNGIDWESIKEKANKLGTNIALFLNGLIDPETFYAMGNTIAQGINTAFEYASGFITNFSFANLGESIGNYLNGLVKNINWALVGQTFSDLFIGILDTAISLLSTIDPIAMGNALADFFKNINWAELADKVFTLLQTLFDDAVGLLVGFWENADTGTKFFMSILGLFTVAKLVIKVKNWFLPIFTDGFSGVFGSSTLRSSLGTSVSGALGSTEVTNAASASGKSLGSIIGKAMAVAAAAIFSYNYGLSLSNEDQMWKDEASGFSGFFKAIGASFALQYEAFNAEQQGAYNEILKQAQEVFMINEEGFAENLGTLVQDMKDKGFSLTQISDAIADVMEKAKADGATIYRGSIQQQIEYNRKKSGLWEEEKKAAEDNSKAVVDAEEKKNEQESKLHQGSIEITKKAIADRVAEYKKASEETTTAVVRDYHTQKSSAEEVATTTQQAAGEIKASTDEIKETLTEIQDKGSTICEVITEAFSELRGNILNTFHDMATKINSPLNRIIQSVETMINNCIGGLGSLSKALTDAGNTGANVKAFIAPTKVAIPRLATGAVIPPNAPFFAQLGDQKNGTNLEAPEGLIRKIIREEMGSGNVNIEFTGDLAQLGRVLQPVIRREEKRRGVSLVN